MDLSRKYIQFTRDRTEDPTIFKIIYDSLLDILKMFSITCPYISEHLYLKLKEKYKLKEESIHACSWPKADIKKVNKKLEKEFESLFQVIEAGLAERDKNKVGLKWPLASVKIQAPVSFSKDLISIIERQLNIKKML